MSPYTPQGAIEGPLRAILGPDGRYYAYYIATPSGALEWAVVPIPAEAMRAANDS